MVIGITYKNQKLIFQEGDKERARTLLKDSGITPEDVKDWFKAEYNNPCCLEPQLELRLLEDLRIAFFCKNCQSWRFRDNLNASKNQFEDAFNEHILWLKKQPLHASKLKQKYPEYYEAIIEAINNLEAFYKQEDFQGFKEALVQVEEDLVKECLNLEQDKVEEPTESEPIRLDRWCVVCGSDSWIRLSKSRTAAIKCKNCNHVELQSFLKR